MIVIGLTGSIGMGKSTVASMLQREGVPTHDADEEVHTLLGPGGRAVPAVAAAFPYFSYPQVYAKKNRAGIRPLKRAELGKIVFKDEDARRRLEDILHPLVREAQNDFIRRHQSLGRKVVALDIPLLFETGGEDFVHYTLCVTAPYFVQKARVLARAGMTDEKFHAILEAQMPDGEKQARADFVIRTGLGRAHTMRQLKTVLKTITAKKIHE